MEIMWDLEDLDVRVEAAFWELVERRKEVMEELVRLSKKELTITLMNLLEFEKVVLSEVEREELKSIKEEQKQEDKTSNEQLSEARQEKEKVRKKETVEMELAVVRGEVTPPNTPNKRKARSYCNCQKLKNVKSQLNSDQIKKLKSSDPPKTDHSASLGPNESS